MTVLPFNTKYYLPYPVGENMEAIINHMKEASFNFEQLKHFHNRKINIFCRGSSGAILSAIFSSFLPIKKYSRIVINHIKKPGESSHSNNEPIYLFPNDVILIIDDFIASGNTLREIKKHIPAPFPVHCLILGGSRIKNEYDFQNELGFVPDYLICKD